MHTSSKVKAIFLSVALILPLFVAMFQSSAENKNISMKDFAKNSYPGASVVFSADDVKDNTLSKIAPTAFLISGLPLKDVGNLTLNNRILSEGSIISAEDFEALLFTPNTNAEFSAEISLLPLSSSDDISLAGTPITVTLNFSKEQNSPPVCAEIELETYKNLPIELNLSAYDHDGDELSFTLVSQSGNGELTFEDGRLIFCPKEDKLGDFTVSYYSKDSKGNSSALASAKIKVTKPKSDFSYVDISDPTKEYYAIRLAECGIFRGESYGETNILRSSSSFTRTEFTALCASAFEISLENSAEISTSGIPDWQTPYLPTAVAAGAFDGTDLSSPVTTRSAAYIALEILEEKLGADLASDSLQFAKDCGIISSFAENRELTREEALEIICKLLDVYNGKTVGWKTISAQTP